jgi:glycosyltransferase involved in cell wall biosynthesis
MRILHLSHSDLQGGAARAAERLVRGLRLLGADARFLVKNKISDDPRTLQAIPAGGPEAASLEEQATLVRKYCVERHRTPLSNSLFSLPVPACAVAAHEEISLADVVNLHWISGLVSPAEIGRVQALGKPVVWTLHDQRAFTGGCHYSAGCRNFAQLCRNCPQLEDDDLGLAPAALQESISQIRPSIAVVSPSRWLADFAAQSALFRQARVTVIPYGLDTEVFQPGRAEARRRLQWDDGAVYLLFGADNFAETRKGFDLFCAAVRACLQRADFQSAVAAKKINLVFFGNSDHLPSVDFSARWLGRFDSDATLARIYAASDAFILPTREDNLPNTMLESTCCGTPVIGFSVGGLPDVIVSGKNGILVPPLDVPALAEAIQSLSFNAELRHKLAENCRTEIPPRFSLRTQAGLYLKLYEEEMVRQARERASTTATTAPPFKPFGAAFGEVFPALVRRARSERRAAPWNSVKNLLAGRPRLAKAAPL